MLGYFFAGAAGAVVAYFLDPDRGRRRRNVTRDRLMALLRRQAWHLSRMGRRAAGTAYGISQQVSHAPEIREALDDATLARKVESEVFRDRLIAKGAINVNVEDGVVVLRGQVDRPEDVLGIEDVVRRIPDVLDVQNLLHLAGEPAPNKAEAISAERAPTGDRQTEAQAKLEPGDGQQETQELAA